MSGSADSSAEPQRADHETSPATVGEYSWADFLRTHGYGHAVDDLYRDNQAYEYVERISDRSTLVIDTIDPLESAEPRRLWSFLNGVRSRLEETGSLGVLNAMNGRTVPPNRDVTEHFADVVFELKTDTRGRGGVHREPPVRPEGSRWEAARRGHQGRTLRRGNDRYQP